MNKYLTELHLHKKESSSCSEISAKKRIEEYTYVPNDFEEIIL